MVTIFNLCLGRAIFVLLMTGISFLDRIVIQGFSLIVGLWVGILAGTQFSMEIKIFGHLEACAFLKLNPNIWDVIFISSPKDKFCMKNSEKIPSLSKSCLEILFEDISEHVKGFRECRPKHITQALQFAEGKEKLIVTCQAGISRSSAMAYVIQSSLTNHLDALKVLDPKLNWPNERVVKLGSKVLKNPEMVKSVESWKESLIS